MPIKTPKELVDKIIALRKQGITLQVISQTVGVKFKTVCSILNKAQVTLPQDIRSRNCHASMVVPQPTVDSIIALHKAGKTKQQISEELNLTPDTLNIFILLSFVCLSDGLISMSILFFQR